MLKIGVGAGLTLAKSNDQKQFNADGSVSYESTSYNISASIHSIFSQQRDAEDTNRQSADIRLTRLIGSHWGLIAINTYLKNDEQSLNLRTIVGGGPGYELVNKAEVRLSLFGGLAWNNEQYAPEAALETTDSTEALAGFTLSYFRFKQWEFDTFYLLYPSLSETGRVRQSLNAQLRLRLIRGKPFWLNISQTLDLDSEPPENTPGNRLRHDDVAELDLPVGTSRVVATAGPRPSSSVRDEARPEPDHPHPLASQLARHHWHRSRRPAAATAC